MSEMNRDSQTPRSSNLLSREEEDHIREQVRKRLAPEKNGTMPRNSSDPAQRSNKTAPARDREVISERLRIMRDEEDRIYAEQGLYLSLIHI